MAAACYTDSRWATPPGYVTEARMRAGMQSQVGRAASVAAREQARNATQMEDIVERGYVIIGSPDEVVEQLTEVATSLNVGHLMLLLQYGNMNKELTKYNTKLFAEAVMPKLKPLFDEWEDRWWPQPMDTAQRAEVPAFVPGLAAEYRFHRPMRRPGDETAATSRPELAAIGGDSATMAGQSARRCRCANNGLSAGSEATQGQDRWHARDLRSGRCSSSAALWTARQGPRPLDPITPGVGFQRPEEGSAAAIAERSAARAGCPARKPHDCPE